MNLFNKTIFLILILISISCQKKSPKKSDKKNPKDTYLIDFVDSIKVKHSLTENPLIVIDGVAIEYESMSEDWFIMNKEDIYSLEYLKNGEANLFGSRGEFGVVSLGTKLYQLNKLKLGSIHDLKIIYVMDGKVVTKEFVKKFDKSKIISIEEIYDKKTIAEFTSKKYNEVVYITTNIPTK